MDRKAWRDRAAEPALEPDLPIIDAHHHLWTNSPADPFEPYDHEALLADKLNSGHNIIATVYADAHSNYRTTGPEHLKVVGETEHADWVAEEGLRRGGRSAGICAASVTNADLTMGAAVGEVLDAHMAASKRFRGIRHMTAFDPELPHYGGSEYGTMALRDFRDGLKELQKRDLTFDAWLFHPQLPEMIDLARAFPNARMVQDHLGGLVGVGRFADRRKEAFAEWKKDMARLAECPNVTLKVGGLNMYYTGLVPGQKEAAFSSEQMAQRQRDIILTAIDLFGPSRCMFESNFPVDMLYTSYTNVWNTFKRVTKDFSAAERADLFAGTAQRAYRIHNIH
ncbi:MAG: amidohydrolase family protein [Caulobacterales bacterium]